MKLCTNLAMVHEAHPMAASDMDSDQFATARDIAVMQRRIRDDVPQHTAILSAAGRGCSHSGN
jgi:D-alanyl-D-alanine carboxypeptidase